MKHLILITLLAVIGSAQAQIPNGSHPLAVAESIIAWKVDYSVGTKGHEGTLKLTSGSILVKGGVIQGGSFVIDMNSVHVTDMKPDDGGKDLEEHLKNNDFLSTNEFPKGYFTVLNSVKNATGKFTISGYLILKGVSNAISFPVIITESKTDILVKAEFTVNRTLWGINYQSGVIGTIKDEMISDDMNISLNFYFKKAQ